MSFLKIHHPHATYWLLCSRRHTMQYVSMKIKSADDHYIASILFWTTFHLSKFIHLHSFKKWQTLHTLSSIWPSAASHCRYLSPHAACCIIQSFHQCSHSFHTRFFKSLSNWSLLVSNWFLLFFTVDPFSKLCVTPLHHHYIASKLLITFKNLVPSLHSCDFILLIIFQFILLRHHSLPFS